MTPSTTTRVTQLEITNGILYSLATLTVGLRFYTRSKIIRKICASDWWILVAWLLATGQIVLWTFHVYLGGVEHIWDIKPQNLQHILLLCWIVQMVYPLGLWVIKTSVLFLYLELFPSDNFRKLIFFVMGFISVMTTACIFAFMFQCTPIQSIWNTAAWTDRYCVSVVALANASSALYLLTDVVVLFMPIKYLIALRISARERIQVIILMSLGGLTCIASAMRFRAISVLYKDSDFTWNSFELCIWSSFEYHLALILACVPTIKPLYIKCVRKLLSLTRGKLSTTRESSETNQSTFLQPELKLLV